MYKIYTLVVAFIILISCQSPTEKPCKMKENEVISSILNRRSIRSYRTEQLSKNQLDTLVRCGVNAPSALNLQTWQLRVVQNPALLADINAEYIAFMKDKAKQGSAIRSQQPGFSVFHGAPTVIFVAAEKDSHYSAVDCGLLGQNILLSAHSMGIGSCVIGSVVGYLNSSEVKDTLLSQLQLPENYQLLYAISLGYPNETPESKPRDMTKVQFID